MLVDIPTPKFKLYQQISWKTWQEIEIQDPCLFCNCKGVINVTGANAEVIEFSCPKCHGEKIIKTSKYELDKIVFGEIMDVSLSKDRGKFDNLVSRIVPQYTIKVKDPLAAMMNFRIREYDLETLIAGIMPTDNVHVAISRFLTKPNTLKGQVNV
jgi:hypothetical protein